ncbi:ABC transporter ATP-binding protein [Planctomycetota bacterium]
MSMHARGHGRTQTDDKAPKLKITDRRMLGWFYRNLKPYRLRILLSILAMLVATGAGLWEPIIFGAFFDQVVIPGNLQPLLVLTLLYLGVFIAQHLFGALRTLTMHLLGYKFMYQVRMQCYRHLMTLGMDYFERQRSGDIMSRISNDVQAVESMVVHGTDEIISKSFHIVMAIAVLFVIDWRAALVATVPVPIFVASLWVFARYIRPVFRTIRKELGEINVKLQERIGGVRVIKSFAREDAETEYFDESSMAYCKATSKSTVMWGLFNPALSMITSAGLVILIWYCTRQAVLGFMTAGTVIIFIRYMQRFYRPIQGLAHVQNLFNRALASMARIFELLDEEPAVKDKENAIVLEKVKGHVEIDRVSFKYETGEMILRNISVTAEPGEVIAIVGRSGAGKTSLINLLPRFYDPLHGSVRIDGHDIRDVTQDSLRQNIGLVLQETFLFNATVRENISYARPDATDEEIETAARAAHAHDFVSQFPEGYDSLIGERGVRLSGGEKQRISIARAFLADPRILILDEATSMVDTEAEQIIQQALSNLMEGRTVFIIAHRLSTVRNANNIVVIDDGEVVEQDRHDHLMAKNGLYKEMVFRQFQLDTDFGQEDGIMEAIL